MWGLRQTHTTKSRGRAAPTAPTAPSAPTAPTALQRLLRLRRLQRLQRLQPCSAYSPTAPTAHLQRLQRTYSADSAPTAPTAHLQRLPAEGPTCQYVAIKFFKCTHTHPQDTTGFHTSFSTLSCPKNRVCNVIPRMRLQGLYARCIERGFKWQPDRL